MTKEQLLYSLAQTIFLKKMPIDYLNDKSKKDYENKMDDAIAIAKLFFERVENDETSNRR